MRLICRKNDLAAGGNLMIGFFSCLISHINYSCQAGLIFFNSSTTVFNFW
jgi:hypothetical protein